MYPSDTDEEKRIDAVITKYEPRKLKSSKKETNGLKLQYIKYQSDNYNMAKTPDGGTYNPFEHREVRRPTTDLDTFMHLLKGSLGSGILAMPMAFRNSGLWFGLGSTLIVGIICTYCVHILVKCAHILCHRRQIPSLSFADVGEQAFLDSSSTRIQNLAYLIRFSVDFFLVLDLVGTCCIYIVFIAKNTKQIVDYYFESDLDVRIYMVIIMLPLILICLIRNLKLLAPFSMIANFLILFSVVVIMYYIFIGIPPITSVKAVAEPKQWPLFFGVVIFALEGIGVVMSLENDMKNPTHFIGCPSVLNFGMGTVIALYTALGFLGYWRYGEKTCGSISLNVPTEEYLAQCVKGAISLAIALTYALQLYVPVNIIWRALKKRIPSEKHLMGELSLRTFLVIITTAIAVAVPEIGPMISLIGAVCLSMLGLVIPAIIEIVVYREYPGWGIANWRLYKNCLLITFGFLGFGTGIYVSIKEIIETYVEASISTCS